jgi:hypothetical protein
MNIPIAAAEPNAQTIPQPVLEPASQQTLEPEKSPVSKIIIIVCIVAIALPVVSITAIFGVINISCNNKTSNLRKSVEVQQKNLDSLSIINGQKTVSSGTVEGDCLTGNADYQSAGATFNNLNQPLKTLSSDIQNNMINQGYTYGPEGQRKSLYGAATVAPAVVVDGAIEYYTKNSNVVIVKYKYNVPFTTPCQKHACEDITISNFDSELSQKAVSTVSVRSKLKSTFDPQTYSYQ